MKANWEYDFKLCSKLKLKALKEFKRKQTSQAQPLQRRLKNIEKTFENN